MPLYLIHGALGAADQMQPLEDALWQRDVRVIELPGHGHTPLNGVPFSIDAFAEHIVAMLDADACDEADFLGYSLGGYVALVVALTHPARVRRVMTLGTKFEWTRAIAERETSRLDPVKIRAKVPKFAESLEFRHRIAGGWETVLGNTAALMHTIGERPQLRPEELGRIAQPICVGVGDRDATVGVDEKHACVPPPPGWITRCVARHITPIRAGGSPPARGPHGIIFPLGCRLARGGERTRRSR
ncbi:MAG: alpha/beta fold hydrolase [Gemmatimonadota bacterium]